MRYTSTVRLTVPDILSERAMTPYALAKLVEGRVSRSAVYRMAAGEKVSLGLDEIAALCDALEVEPGTLFERVPDRKGKRG
jgi:DNA-binding Xre family transcriptional regulator